MRTAYQERQDNYDQGFSDGRNARPSRFPLNPDYAEGYSDGRAYDREYPLLD